MVSVEVEVEVEEKGSRQRTRLQAADKVPLDGARQQVGLLAQLLGVVLAKVGVAGGILVQGEDVVGGLELGHGDEADLRVCQWENN